MKMELKIIGAAGILVATTIGAGIFALPYVTAQAGWAVGFTYLIVLGAVLWFVHRAYGDVVIKTEGKSRLLGLARRYGGRHLYHFAFIAIVAGLLITLTAYLILAKAFFGILLPGVDSNVLLLIAWALLSVPTMFRMARIIDFELFGAYLMGGIILIVFITAHDMGSIAQLPRISLDNLFVPFGPLLFALAGWTAIEPMARLIGSHPDSRRLMRSAVTVGTLAVVLLYILFVMGIVGSAGAITPDTISGLVGWPAWKIFLLTALGIFAVWTSYVPISLEIEQVLVQDALWPAHITAGLVLLFPLAFVFAGFENFISAVALAGGVFIACQYLVIVFVAKRAHEFKTHARFILLMLSFVFLIAALYEIGSFIVK